MRGHRRAPRERGASTAIVALAITVLCGSGAISVDYGHLSLEKRKVQNAADAAARAVAIDCGQKSTACNNDAATRSTMVLENAGSAATSTGTKAGNTYAVTVSKPVGMSFGRILGADSRTVTASATASWTSSVKVPSKGSPKLPLGIPYCSYINNKPAVGNGAGPPTFYRTDTFQQVRNLLASLPLLGTVLTTLVQTLTGTTETCKDPGGNTLVMLQGGVWLSGVQSVSGGLFDYSSPCKLRVASDVNTFVGALLSGVIPPDCAAKFGTTIRKGETILVPIYVPQSNLAHLGLKASACLLGLLCANVPPLINAKILGFAPFKITGWDYGAQAVGSGAIPGCSNLSILTVTIGCTGIEGYFVRSSNKYADFTYTAPGSNNKFADLYIDVNLTK